MTPASTQLSSVNSTTVAGLAQIPEKLQFMVVGDIMVDHYISGSVERISPEAPVPILDAGGSWNCPGGAANVAENLITLGAAVTLAGRIGDDSAGKFLVEHFGDRARLELVTFRNYRTERKVRFVTDSGQLLRVDYRSPEKHLDMADRMALVHAFRAGMRFGIPKNAIVVPDYGKGAVNEMVINEVRMQGVTCYVDCKPSGLTNYRHSADSPMVLKPNIKEFIEMGGHVNEDHSLGGLAGLRDVYSVDEMLVTRGANGMTVIYDGLARQQHLPSLAQEVYNVIGAGDTALAVYAWCRTGGLDEIDAAIIGNVAASLVVRKRETGSVSREELMAAVEQYAAVNS